MLWWASSRHQVRINPRGLCASLDFPVGARLVTTSRPVQVDTFKLVSQKGLSHPTLSPGSSSPGLRLTVSGATVCVRKLLVRSGVVHL